MQRIQTVLATAILTIAFLPAELQARQRTLHWPELIVDARLDADGVLHIRERQVMEMSGSWNGGERVFNLGRGRLMYDALSREDPSTGQLASLQRGSLDVVDQWDFTDRATLRWRSRQPSDPAFDRERLIYVLEYRLSDILIHSDGTFYLDHDFAFTDRDGVIERFELTLSLAPEWQAPPGFEAVHSRQDLYPGSGFVLRTELNHSGSEPPRAVVYPRPPWIFNAIFPAVLLGLIVLYRKFRETDRPLGRWQGLEHEPTPDAESIQAAFERWLPEELGALWDQKTGAAEVAAVIARLVAEGKLESRVEKGGFFNSSILELERQRPRGEFQGYEKKLINKLFFNNRRRVTTKDLRKHYRKKGLDLVKVIKPPIERALRRKLGTVEARTKVSPNRTALLIAASVVLGAVDLLLRRHEIFGPVVHALLFLYLIFTFVALYLPFLGYANSMQRRVHGVGSASMRLLAAPAAMIIVLWVCRQVFGTSTPSLDVTVFGAAALALWILGLTSSIFNMARSRLPREGVKIRRGLAAIRRWIVRELRQPDPKLEDSWLPYLLAYGLDGRVDSWFKRFGGTASSTMTSSSLNTSSTASGSAGASMWTGGGGSFGGAGATAAWATAVTGLASGVAAASSGSGGSGGGGGGSSGGGGGGGW